MKKLILILLSVLFCLSCLASCNQQPDEQDPAETTLESTDPETETEEITTGAEDKLAMEKVDFIVSVPADRQAVVLQLTDPQIIDASQARTSQTRA